MNGTRIQIVLGALAAGLVLAGCGAGSGQPDGGSGSDGGTQAASLTLAYDLDTGHAATQQIGPEGGTLTTTGADGTVYTVTVPAGALTETDSLTITPLTGASVDGEQAAWQVGVDLEPQGLAFTAPATLQIQPADTAPPEATVVLVDKGDDTFAPMAASGGTKADLVHFSTYLVTRVTDDRLTAAVNVSGDGLVATPSVHWVLVLEHDLLSARDLGFSPVTQAAQQALAKAQAAIDAATTEGKASPGPRTFVPLLQAEQLATLASLPQLAAATHGAGLAIFDAWLTQLGTQVNTNPTWSLLPPVETAMTVATQSLPERVGAASTVLGQLIGALQAQADQACDSGDFATGRGQLDQLAGIAGTFSLSTPSSQSLGDDASTCYPPKVTAAYASSLPANLALVLQHDQSLGADLGSQRDSDPPSGTPMPAVQTTPDTNLCPAYTSGGMDLMGNLANPGLLAQTTLTGSAADFSFGGTSDGADIGYTLTFGGHATPAPDATDMPSDDILTKATGQAGVTWNLEFENPRGTPFDVVLSWQLNGQTTDVTGPPAGATMSTQVSVLGCPNPLSAVSPVTLSGESGSQTITVGAAAASSAQRVTLTFDFHATVVAYADYFGATNSGATETGSASMDGTLNVVVVPPTP